MAVRAIRTVTSPDPAAHAEEIVAEAVQRAVDERGRCFVALSGGRTPLALYRLLAQRRGLPWGQVELFWGDERFVPHDHPDSNAGALEDVLISKVPIPPGQVHRWPILESAGASARAYELTLRERTSEVPMFDIDLLGLGRDCHTASLFPEAQVLDSPGLTVATRAPDGQQRLSLTVPALSSSRLVLFLVTGEEKRPALMQLLAAEGDRDICPARAITALERLMVVTDLAVS
ncbi:MAG TPA: 6-phosphogluconolactonase [Trueperaceae bacterium]